MRRLSGLAAVVAAAVAFVVAVPTPANAARVPLRTEPKILSASWGTDNAVGCPSGEKGLDNIPVTFNWFVRPTSIQVTDFQIVRNDGTTATPTCALQFPPDEPDEAQTVNLIGNFGDSVNGPTPVTIRVVGDLEGRAPQTPQWKPITGLPDATVEPLPGGDANRCTVGNRFVRVMWSNGLTAYPTGTEVGAVVLASYRALYKLTSGKVVRIAPLAIADPNDHPTAANSDNMHDLCLPRVPRGAKLAGVTIGAGLIQDPNGDPNSAQKFR